MKTKVFLLCAASLLFSVSGSAQKPDLSRISTRTVTLVSRFKGKPEKSLFSFKYGKRGDAKVYRESSLSLGSGGSAGPADVPRRSGDLTTFQEPPNYGQGSGSGIATPSGGSSNQASPVPGFDIRYGSAAINGDDNWLAIVASKGVLGMIKDMGEMSWSEVDQVPLLVLDPHPRGPGVSIIRGKPTFFPEGNTIKPIVGHVYVVHLRENKKDRYAMFRVEAVDPKGECTISWKRVPTPKQ